MDVVDLNADVGEFERSDVDAALMPHLSSANIACGVHAGSPETMRVAVELATRHGVAVGAHPGLDDRAHFGRRELVLSPPDVIRLVSVQIESLLGVAMRADTRVRHVKPHGALYNMAARDRQLAQAIVSAVAAVDRSLTVVGLSGSELIRAGIDAGLRTASEAFADRSYRRDGSLLPRDVDGALLVDPDVVAERAVAMVRDQRVVAVDGTAVALTVETLCVHGDTPGAVELAGRVRGALEAAGVSISANR